MNILIPFNPQRNDFIKSLGRDLTAYRNGNPVKLYLIVRQDQFSFPAVGAFYLPIGSLVAYTEEGKVEILPGNKENFSSLCFIEKNFINSEMEKQSVFLYNEGAVIKCKIAGSG